MSKQVLIIRDAPRIDRYVYTVIRPDGTREHFTTRFAAYQHLRSLMPPDEVKFLVSYPQVTRHLKRREHHTIATKERKVYQLLRSEVKK